MIPRLEDSECPTCRKLTKERKFVYADHKVDDYLSTGCACMLCLKIYKHLKERHPELLALVELTDPKIFGLRRHSYAKFGPQRKF